MLRTHLGAYITYKSFVAAIRILESQLKLTWMQLVFDSALFDSAEDIEIKVTSEAVEAESIALVVTSITTKYATRIERDGEEGEGVDWMARVADHLR